MDKINAAREKYKMPSDEELNHAFRTDFPRLEEILREREQNFVGQLKTPFEITGLNIKLQELKSKVEISEESLSTEKQILNTKLQELNSCNDRLKELETDRNNLLQEVNELERQKNKLKNRAPSARDQQIIQHGKKKFEYYKCLTGIRWDFGAPKGTTKGYVTNGQDYIHTFNLKIPEHYSELEDQLWNEIGRATGRLDATETDENGMPNN